MAREKFRISIVVVSLMENVYEVGRISGVASLGGFANYINNYIYYSTAGETLLIDDRDYPVYNFVQDKAFLRGVEASLTLHPVSWIHFENSFSYTRATNRTTKESLPFIPAAALRCWRLSKRAG